MIKKGDKNSNLLEAVPGVGKSIAKDLRDIGIHWVADLKGRDPKYLYEALCHKRRTTIDPCILYVFRCAVYFAENEHPDPELLKWWNWKNRTLQHSKTLTNENENNHQFR